LSIEIATDNADNRVSGGQLVKILGASRTERSSKPVYVAYVLGFVGGINIYPFTN
jgi:hypothetical protein